MSACVCFTTGSTQPTAISQEQPAVPVVSTPVPVVSTPVPVVSTPVPVVFTPVQVVSTPTATSHHQPTEHIHVPGADDNITIYFH